jgi:hypothetical protein
MISNMLNAPSSEVSLAKRENDLHENPVVIEEKEI